jgi:hypothetical protein
MAGILRRESFPPTPKSVQYVTVQWVEGHMTRRKHDLDCRNCGSQFEASRSHARWCGSPCRENGYRVRHGIKPWAQPV